MSTQLKHRVHATTIQGKDVKQILDDTLSQESNTFILIMVCNLTLCPVESVYLFSENVPTFIHRHF